MSMDSEERVTVERCGARAKEGPCVLPKGHNTGRADIPSNHSSTPDPVGEGERWIISRGYDAAGNRVTARAPHLEQSHVDGPITRLISVVPESRATDAEAERDEAKKRARELERGWHDFEGEAMRATLDYSTRLEAVEAERDRLRESLDKLQDVSEYPTARKKESKHG